METPKAPAYQPQSRGPTDVERQDSPGTPPATDEGTQAAVERQVEESSGTA